MIKKFWGVLFVLLLSFWAVEPLFHPGFFPVHDDTQVARVYEMAQALKAGQFPVRWVGDLGYGFGYPIFNFYAPLPYYVGALFNLTGFNPLIATKLMFLMGVLASGLFMYLLARQFWGKLGGIISALFYLYAPYHGLDIYVRGAVGEFWAMAFLPLVFLGIYKIFQKRHWGATIAGLSFAALILSHNLTAMMLLPFILLTFLTSLVFSKTPKYFILNTFYFILFSLGFSSFYWLPALSEMGYTRVYGQIGGGASFRDHFVFPDQLWASPWGYGGSAPGRLDGMSFMIGKIQILASFFSLAVAFWLWRKKNQKIALTLFFAFALFLLSCFLTTHYSLFIWERIPVMAFIQYPWRFLIFATFFASFMAGFIFWFFKSSKFTLPTFLGIVLALLFLNGKYFKPQLFLNVTSGFYTSEEALKWKTSKISDEYLPREFSVPKAQDEVAWEKVVVRQGEAEISHFSLKPHRYSFNLTAQTKTELLLNTAYFPGWQVKVNGEKSNFSLEEGKIKLNFLPSEYQVNVFFGNTLVRSLANAFSFLALMGFGLLFVLKYGEWKS